MAIRSSIAKPLKAELIAARIHNSRQWEEDKRRRRFSANDYYFLGGTAKNYWLIQPGSTGPDASTGKGSDVMAGAACGVLPFYTNNGDDGLLILPDGSTERVELKLAQKTSGRYTVGDQGAIRVKGDLADGKKPGVWSDIKAYYEIVNNLKKKKVKTYLVIQDVDTWEIIDILCVRGEEIIKRLKIDQSTGKSKTSRKRSIPASFFRDNGERIRPDGTEVLGFEAWEDRIYARDGKSRDDVKKVNSWTKVQENKLLELVDKMNKSYLEAAAILGVSKSSVAGKLAKLRKAKS